MTPADQRLLESCVQSITGGLLDLGDVMRRATSAEDILLVLAETRRIIETLRTVEASVPILNPQKIPMIH